MVFSNAVFLFGFLPVVLILYKILPQGFKNLWLFLVSIVFYGWSNPPFVWILLSSIVINYIGAICIDRLARQKLLLVLTLVLDLGLLVYFKYFNFLADIAETMLKREIGIAEIALPIGISFFTFQGISYVVDVYRKEVPAQKSFIKLGAYISMFPQLVAGPIVRYRDINEELEKRQETHADTLSGIERFITGLFKKTIIADSMAVVADQIFSYDPAQFSCEIGWIGIVAYSLQIFFDFSGYSDMAIGLGRILGFHFVENFDHPYISKSITEFWRRWHISLSSFFRDYVYIPLGGNRKHVYLNVAIVFLLTGIWHGAAYTFVVWGIWHGVFNLLEKRTGFVALGEKNPVISVLKRIYTLFIVMIGWVFFRAENLAYAWRYIMTLLGIRKCEISVFSAEWFFSRWNSFIFLLALAGCVPLAATCGKTVSKMIGSNGYLTLKYLILLGMLGASVLNVASNTYSAFIYFQF